MYSKHSKRLFFQAALSPSGNWPFKLWICLSKGDLIISKPQFMQQYLTPIRTMSQADQILILQKVIDKQIT